MTERSREFLWLAPGRSLLLRLFVSSILRFSEDVWFLHACKIECLLPQSPLMGGPRVGATSNPLPGFERRVARIYPLGPGTFIRTDHLTQQPSHRPPPFDWTVPAWTLTSCSAATTTRAPYPRDTLAGPKPQVWTSERRVLSERRFVLGFFDLVCGTMLAP